MGCGGGGEQITDGLTHELFNTLVPRLSSWLKPPVETHLTAYGFNVTNPEEVMQGGKPKLEEVGPFVYRAVTVKDSVDLGSGRVNLQYDEGGETLTYRPRYSSLADLTRVTTVSSVYPRKFYFLDREASVGDPEKTFITAPNIPLLTVANKIREI